MRDVTYQYIITMLHTLLFILRLKIHATPYVKYHALHVLAVQFNTLSNNFHRSVQINVNING